MNTSMRLLAVTAFGFLFFTAANAQPASAPMPAKSASAANSGTNKAGKPPVAAAASQAGAATDKPAKPGSQSGAASAPAK